MKYLTDDDLKFSIYNGKVGNIDFSVHEDGDVEMYDPPRYISVKDLSLISAIAKDFFEGRKKIADKRIGKFVCVV